MTGTRKGHDVAVIGGGVVGAATASALARRGRRTLLLERFVRGHDRGSSHGDGRIIRFTYTEPVYLEMARRSYAAWAEIERASGKTLVEVTGSFECGPADAPQLGELETSFGASGIAYERLGAAAAARRFPCFRLPPASEAIVQADGGILRAGRAVLTLWELARTAGVELREGVEVAAIEPGDDGVRIVGAAGDVWEAEVAVITAGGWAPRLLAGLGLDLPLRVSQEQVAYFPPRPGAVDHRLGAMPTFVDYHDAERPHYALPWIDVPGVKVGWHRSGRDVDPDRRPELDDDNLAALVAYVGERFPHLLAEPLERVGCLYTLTPDYHFVLDRHPQSERVVVGAGFSGHGFKFAPVLGEILASLAGGDAPPLPLETFRLARFAAGRLERRRGA